MLAYVARRLVLILPTLFGIMVVNFVIVQAAPGGPVELMIARIKGTAVEATARVGSAGGEMSGQAGGVTAKKPGARGVRTQLIRPLEKLHGLDQPGSLSFF